MGVYELLGAEKRRCTLCTQESEETLMVESVKRIKDGNKTILTINGYIQMKKYPTRRKLVVTTL